MRIHQPAVDFAYVRPEHKAIDARLANWSRWARGRGRGPAVSLLGRLYRAPRQDWRTVPQAVCPVDAIDAALVERAVVGLPAKHRMAVCWSYIAASNPRRAAHTIGVTMQELADLVHDARDRLARI